MAAYTERARLATNIDKIRKKFKLGGIKLFVKYLLLTFKYGVENGVENAYIVNTANDIFFLRHIVGTKDNIVFPPDLIEKIDNASIGTLSLFHNHPWSIAPSVNDYNMFFSYKAIRDTSVCGHNGNLYYLRKQNAFYNFANEEIKMLLDSFWNIHRSTVMKHMIDNGYEPDSPTMSDKVKKKVYGLIQEELFVHVCERGKSKGLQGYREEV